MRYYYCNYYYYYYYLNNILERKYIVIFMTRFLHINLTLFFYSSHGKTVCVENHINRQNVPILEYFCLRAQL